MNFKGYLIGDLTSSIEKMNEVKVGFSSSIEGMSEVKAIVQDIDFDFNSSEVNELRARGLEISKQREATKYSELPTT